MKKNEKTPKTTVNRPSKIKIQAHPGLLPTPSMLMIPKASKPEKAPEIEAAEKKAETLLDVSSKIEVTARKKRIHTDFGVVVEGRTVTDRGPTPGIRRLQKGLRRIDMQEVQHSYGLPLRSQESLIQARRPPKI